MDIGYIVQIVQNKLTFASPCHYLSCKSGTWLFFQICDLNYLDNSFNFQSLLIQTENRKVLPEVFKQTLNTLYSTDILFFFFSGCFYNTQSIHIIIQFGNFMNQYFQLFNNIHQPLVRFFVSASSRDRMVNKKKQCPCSRAAYCREWKTNTKSMITPRNVYLSAKVFLEETAYTSLKI